MVLKIIRWFFGYVNFNIDQKKSRLFLNLVSKSKFYLWDINKFDDKLFAKITSSEYIKLNSLLKRNNIKLHIVEKIGFPFFYLKYKNRKGVIVGIILFFTILRILSLFIWKINIIGNEQIDIKLILESAKNNKICIGSIKKNIDAQSAGQNIMSDVSGISWISVNLDGCVANINIKDQVNKLEDNIDKNRGDIFSSCDAQIVRMETFSGTPLVHVGDIVLKNQLLVGAYEKTRDGNLKEVNATANILAKVIEEVSEFEKFDQILENPTGREKEIFKFNFFGKNLSLNFWQSHEDSWKKEIYENKLKIFGLEIPISFVTEKFVEVNKISKKISKDEAIENARKKAYEKINKEYEVLKCNESYVEREEGIIFKISFEHLKNISCYKK